MTMSVIKESYMIEGTACGPYIGLTSRIAVRGVVEYVPFKL